MDPRGMPCPVCGAPLAGPAPAPCPSCGLPSAGQAAYVVARIEATLTELARDRDALLATLRTSAPGAAAAYAPAPVLMPVQQPPPTWHPPQPSIGAQPPSGPPQAAPAPRRRLSPQEVLLGLGALLVVAAAITFVAVAWTRLGLVFQATVMLTVTALACAVSAWTARRGLRATEEALAAAGAALLVVDLAAARALGLFRLEEVPLRIWSAVSCAVVLVSALALGRVTRTTTVWPLSAILVAQPLPFLLLPPDVLAGPAGVAVALALAAVDLAASRALRRSLVPVALVLAGLSAGAGVVAGLAVAVDGPLGESWTATAVLAVAGVAAVCLTRLPRPAGLLSFPVPVSAATAAVVGLALTSSLQLSGGAGASVATAVGLALLTLAVPAARLPVPAALLTAGGAAMALLGTSFLSDAPDMKQLVLALLGATVPATLAAVRLPSLRTRATGAALLAPALAVLVARADGLLAATVSGLLLALVAATAFALAGLRTGHGEEVVCAAGGALSGLAAGLTSADVSAWGQVGMQLAITGVAAGGYALVSGRRWVGAVAVADLVVASWIAIGGAAVETPEAYTLPLALGLLVVAAPRLRGASSWAAEGTAAGIALVPSALVVIGDPGALRLVLVVAAAGALTVVGTLLHRQAPFVLGAGVLLAVTVGRLAPYAPLLPRWVSLGTVGLLLLVLGATYERRRQQASEAVAWIGQMR